MELAKMTSKGQLTIPKKIRDRLGLHRGDLVAIEADGNRAVLTRVPSRDMARLRALEATLSEWLTDADENAYRDL